MHRAAPGFAGSARLCRGNALWCGAVFIHCLQFPVDGGRETSYNSNIVREYGVVEGVEKAMDYGALAEELVRKVSGLNRTEAYRRLSTFLKGEMFVLCYLDVGNGSALPGDLREAMGVSSARVAAALGALERKGLVARSTDQNDRRRVIVSITQAGRAQVHARQQLLRDNMKYMLRELGEADAREYIRIVGRIIAISQCAEEAPRAGRNEERT